MTFRNDGDICKEAKIEYGVSEKGLPKDDWYDTSSKSQQVNEADILKVGKESLNYNFSAKYLRCFAKGGSLSQYALGMLFYLQNFGRLSFKLDSRHLYPKSRLTRYSIDELPSGRYYPDNMLVPRHRS